ncbi:MAG: serine/threonine-protein kinase [Polyangia bacterium]
MAKAADTGEAADPVAALVAAGDHAAGARLAAERGDLRRAIMLYERIWRFADALPLALQIGDRPLAIRLALDVADGPTAARIADEIPRDATDELRAAAASFGARGNQWEAARMAERAGDASVAASHFRRAGSLLDVGRMEELAGRLREAGLAYEQALAEASSPDDTAAAHLALGRLLARLGRHHDAARALQQAMRRPTCRLEAGRALTTQLVKLGLRVAAAEIVRRLRREWPDLPESPEELAALDEADAAASASSVGQMGTGAGGGAGAPGGGLLRHRFKVLRSLGAGATSHVYLAEDTLLGQPVALKLLSVGAGAGAGARGAERQAYLRFTREAEAAGRLRHPNIVALYDADPALGLFVLEMMSHGTLADRLAEQKVLSPVAVRRVALDLLSALGAAHDAGMVHRDVKPANILFDSVGNAKLADFGAAHLADFGQTQTGGLMGTVAYMSPEQISGGAIGPAADLYALAVTLFEALTGRLPFPGPDIVAQHLSEEPPPPSAVADPTESGAVTGAHDAVLLRALRKAPSERWRSAAQMAEAIRSWPTHVVDAGDGAPSLWTRAKPPTRDAPASTPDASVGRSARGNLFRRDDPALGRPVLVELLDAPPNEDELARLKRLARAGGPHVQRMLGLSEDGRTVSYELCEGPPVPPCSLDPIQAQVIAQAAAELETFDPPRPGEASQRPIVMTRGGPVLLIVSAVSDAESGSSGAT